MIKHDVQLIDYTAAEHGGYVLRMLGELYDGQAKMFRQGAGITLGDPVTNLDGHRIDVIAFDGKRCGVILSTVSGCFDDTVTVSDIILEGEYRRKGIARKALSIVISRALADGAKFINLHVHTDNLPARRLYESLGFRAQSQWMVLHPESFKPTMPPCRNVAEEMREIPTKTGDPLGDGYVPGPAIMNMAAIGRVKFMDPDPEAAQLLEDNQDDLV